MIKIYNAKKFIVIATAKNKTAALKLIKNMCNEGKLENNMIITAVDDNNNKIFSYVVKFNSNGELILRDHIKEIERLKNKLQRKI
jgi:hypothetical protein